MLAAAALNRDMQALFRRWYAHGTRANRAVMWDQGKLDWFLAMNTALRDRLDGEGTRARVGEGLATLRDLAATIRARAGVHAHGIASTVDAAMPGTLPLFASAA